ncbi:hypothetical protein IV203_010856 [Nitzschia inconspicua]|uniref:Uncharacterized protein n=1 Tax=Nitzschia inconspicua TaxID=303405 RepID=A0A9K3KYL4_9STRA|nr:hypothetical protein IV203_010856 [Nitzschia inconspicua]
MVSSPCFMQPNLSRLPSDLLVHSLGFINDNGESMIEAISDLEDAFTTRTKSSSSVLECTEYFWQQLWERDQVQDNQQWKQQPQSYNDKSHRCALRELGRDFLQARCTARHISQLSTSIFDYGCTPVPFFCPTPTRALQDRETKEALRPVIWPFSKQQQHQRQRQRQEYAFVNISQNNADGMVWWEGFRPLNDISESSFSISFHWRSLLEKLPNTAHKAPIELYYRMIGLNRGKRRQQPYFVNDGTNDAVTIVPISKCQQFGTVMRQLQVTILFDDQIVVATGGSQKIVSPLCGQFHDRQYDCMDSTATCSNQPYSVISTSLEFVLAETVACQDKDQLCIKVSRS